MFRPPLGPFIEDATYVPGLKINKEKQLWPGMEWDAITGRHPNIKVNMGFAMDTPTAEKPTIFLLKKPRPAIRITIHSGGQSRPTNN